MDFKKLVKNVLIGAAPIIIELFSDLMDGKYDL